MLTDEEADVEQQPITATTFDPAQLFPDSDDLLPEKPDYRVKAPNQINANAIKKIYESLEAVA